MAQTQIASSPYALRAGVAATKWPSHKAETYPSALLRAGRWGVEIECFLPDQAIRELGISIGSYPFDKLRAGHRGRQLPSPLSRVAKLEGPSWR